MTIDLASEFAEAGRSAKLEHYHRLVALGCSSASIAALACRNWAFGVTRVRWTEDGFYEPDADGCPAVITPAIVDDGGIFTPQPYDLIAWQTTRPRRWAVRQGLVFALGEDLIDECDVLAVVETPLDWMIRAGNCLCIVDWDAPAAFWSRLRSGPRLIVQTEGLRRNLISAMSRSVMLPNMEVSDAA